MTPDESQLLQHVGEVLLSNLGITLMEGILYGVYLLLSIMAMSSLRNRGLKSRGTLFQFTALTVVFIAFTLDMTAMTAILVGLIRGDLISNPDQALEDRLDLANDVVTPWVQMLLWLEGQSQGIIFWVGDAVVVWRACVMFPNSKRIRYALVFMLICGIATAVSAMVLNMIEPLSYLISSTSAQWILQVLSSAIFITVNVAATGLIAKKAFTHRRLLKSSIGQSRSKSLKIMVLLIDSGAIYFCIQTVGLALNFADLTEFSVEDWVTSQWQILTLFTSAAYPAAIVLLVNHQQSIADTPGMTEMMSNAGANLDLQLAMYTSTENASDTVFGSSPSDKKNENEAHSVSSGRSTEDHDLEKGERFVRSCP